jgi:hypothetical protein
VSIIGEQEVARDLPLLALILYFIAQVEDNLPVLASQSLICRFHFFSWWWSMSVNARRERYDIYVRLTDDIVVRIGCCRLEHGVVYLKGLRLVK